MNERDEIRMILAHRLGYDLQAGKSFHLGEAMPLGADWEKRAAIRQATLTGDVGVPLLQAVVSGILAGILAGIAIDLQAGVIAGLVIAALAWAFLVIDHNRQLWGVERLFSGDHPGDGEGDPPGRRVVTVEMIDDNKRRWRFGDLPIDERTAAAVAKSHLVDGVSFSRAALCGANACSQDQYRQFAQWLVGAGLAIQTANNARELTAAGRSLFRALIDEPKKT
jgi:hypothetical protein